MSDRYIWQCDTCRAAFEVYANRCPECRLGDLKHVAVPQVHKPEPPVDAAPELVAKCAKALKDALDIDHRLHGAEHDEDGIAEIIGEHFLTAQRSESRADVDLDLVKDVVAQTIESVTPTYRGGSIEWMSSLVKVNKSVQSALRALAQSPEVQP